MKILKEGTISVKADGTIEASGFHIDAEGRHVSGFDLLQELIEDRVLYAAQLIRESRASASPSKAEAS